MHRCSTRWLCTALIAWPLAAIAADDISEVAARVNDRDITIDEVNLALSRQPLGRPENRPAESRHALEQLIDQSLVIDDARKRGIDQDPRLQQQIEAARRETIARFALDIAAGPIARPTDAEVDKYYAEQPALFSRRRVYTLKEITIDCSKAQAEALRKQLQGSKSLDEFIAHLQASSVSFTANQAVRAAEQLPLTRLSAFAAMKEHQSFASTTPGGLQVIQLESARSEPISLERAAPAIRQFLYNEVKRQRVEAYLKTLRESSQVQRFGAFAP